MKARAIGLRLAAIAGVVTSAWWGSSCAPTGLEDGTIVNSVRILASSADLPYAQPGQTVNLSVLAYDGRASQPEKMTISWLPFVCEDPANDAYYACFSQLGTATVGGADGGDGGGAAGGATGASSFLKPGVDLTPFLPTGPTYQFTMPTDVIANHRPVQSMAPATPDAGPPPTDYGLAILFNIACAGHVELLPVDPANANPQQVPLGCFDAQHNLLGPSDYVFGFTRVFAFQNQMDQNPVIDHVDIEDARGTPFSRALTGTTVAGFAVPHCTESDPDKCPNVKVGPVVLESSWDGTSDDAPVDPHNKQIWVDYFTTFGKLSSGTHLLYDVTSGLVGGPGDTDTKFLTPQQPGDGLIWMVVHDNRGGASWVSIPVHACADGDPACGG